MKLHTLTLLCSILALSACGHYTPVRSSPDYASVISREPLLILPVKAEAYTVGAPSGDERMFDYEEYVEPVILEELSKALQEKGYRATIMHKADLKIDKRYNEYENLVSTFDNQIETVYANQNTAKKENAENTTLHLNGKAKELSDKVLGPVLVYARYNERVKTSGAEAAEFAANVVISALTGVSSSSGPPDNATIRISIIDGKQDKLLWTNSGISMGGDLIDDMINDNKAQSLNHVKTTIKRALSTLPDKDKLFEKKE